MNENLGPLTAQVQAWWTAQHEQCVPVATEREWAQPDMFRLQHIPRPICGIRCGWRNNRTREQLAADMRRYLKSEAVVASQRLEQPDASIALQIAQALVPPPVGDELVLIVDLIDAAGAQTVDARNWKLAGAGVALVLALIYYGTKGQ